MKYKSLKRLYATLIIVWALLILLAFGATAHAFNPRDLRQVTGIFIYPSVCIMAGICLLLMNAKLPARITGIVLLGILSLLHIYACGELLTGAEDGGIIFLLLGTVFLLFSMNVVVLYAELVSLRKKENEETE